MAVPTYTKSGTKATVEAKLHKDVFGLSVENHSLLKQAYDTYLANGRLSLARTKTRGEVRGGGKKPWKQKGTGRARFGSSRVPIWRGGGITFGPTGEENYTKKLPVGAKRQALRQALSLSAKDGHVKVIEAYENKEAKVSVTTKLLGKIEAKGRILLVVSEKDLLIERATRNIPKLKVIQAKYLNVFDILNADSIVVTKPALETVHTWLGDKA
ncbi:MAG: ribosomal protein [Candidatus Saccharibacteria bacterium]|nr:ribosomal protein [Candidatus Saccharibacteria bacterium]